VCQSPFVASSKLPHPMGYLHPIAGFLEQDTARETMWVTDHGRCTDGQPVPRPPAFPMPDGRCHCSSLRLRLRFFSSKRPCQAIRRRGPRRASFICVRRDAGIGADEQDSCFHCKRWGGYGSRPTNSWPLAPISANYANLPADAAHLA